MDVTHTIRDDVRNKQVIWYGHVQRMADHRIPKQILNWQPRGTPRRIWRAGIEKELRERQREYCKTIYGTTDKDGDWKSENVGER
jgi:hypothetical protein